MRRIFEHYRNQFWMKRSELKLQRQELSNNYLRISGFSSARNRSIVINCLFLCQQLLNCNRYQINLSMLYQDNFSWLLITKKYNLQIQISLYSTKVKSMSATDIKRSIQMFLERNSLFETLHAFKNQNSHPQNQKAKNLVFPDKPLICISKKQAYQLQKISSQTIDFHRPEVQDQLREHLQRCDIKLMRKIFDRIKKSAAQHSIDNPQIKRQKGLEGMKFFRKMMDKQAENNQIIRNEIQQRKNNNSLLEESRQYENEWENSNQQGYDINEFYSSEFNQVCKQLKAVKGSDYLSHTIKHVPYPQKYYFEIASYKQRNNLNIYDKYYSRLPAQVKFSSQFKSGQKKSAIGNKAQKEQINDQKENLWSYPIQMNNVVYDCYDLKIIYDRDKTGFEEQRDIKIVINEVLGGKYQIIGNLGQAQFSNAIEVKDLTNQQRYCLKIIQNNKEYFDQSLDEIKILKYIKANCNPDQKCLLNLHDYFYHKEHLMLLTQLLEDTLLNAYQLKRQLFSNLRNIQIITRQLLIGLDQLHELHIAHTDLKPQNILIKSFTNKTVKIIDLGSSVFFHDEPTYYIQTRSYRAPQVILGIPYDGKIDIWSLGCIIAQIFTGQVLFEAFSQATLLALVQGLRGPWPSWMLEKGLKVNNYFTKDMFIFEEILDENKKKTGKCRIFSPKLTNMKARIKSDNKLFLDFLSKCLKIDPSQRMSAKEALQHPFITNTIQS